MNEGAYFVLLSYWLCGCLNFHCSIYIMYMYTCHGFNSIVYINFISGQISSLTSLIKRVQFI